MSILLGILIGYCIYLGLSAIGAVSYKSYEIQHDENGYKVYGKVSLSPFLFNTHAGYFDSVEDAMDFINSGDADD